MKRILLILLTLTLSACAPPVDEPPPPTAALLSATPQPASTSPSAIPATLQPAAGFPVEVSLNDIPAVLTSVPENFTQNICQDTRPLQLIRSLQTAIQTRDGELLASLVDPASGVGVRFIRSGNVITYFENIKFIFETTYQADWGLSAGSGEPIKGSFQEIVLPSLEAVLSSNPLVTCNSLKVGGTTYIPEWPYSGMDYYSVHFPGTDQYAGLDWETWGIGLTRQEGKPTLAALVHYNWEP
ncbi:MAG: hypothetical protein JNK32_07735 [Anaerolineales bacterium]|nr:hypothetical protein [Anaerolineales bacterium]